jgi:hypothetical protein
MSIPPSNRSIFTPESARPAAEQTDAGKARLRICPFLGLAAERSLVLTEPSDEHRCFVQGQPLAPHSEHQHAFCLSEAHVRCPIYAPLPPASNAAPAGATNWAQGGFGSETGADAAHEAALDAKISQRDRLVRRFAWVLTMLVLLCIGLLAGRYLDDFQARRSATPQTVGETAGTIAATDTVAPTVTPTTQPESESANALPAVGEPVLLATEAATPVAVTPEAEASLPNPPATDSSNTDSGDDVITPFVTPTSEADGQVFYITPIQGNVGWWRSNDSVRNHLNDSFLYAGVSAGETYISAIRFDLRKIARGAEIRSSELRLTGLRADQLAANANGKWIVQLIAEQELKNLVRADFLSLYTAPASLILNPQIEQSALGVADVNVWTLDATTRAWIQQQMLEGATSLLVRIAPVVDPAASDTPATLFAWDSGLGEASNGNPPGLLLTTGLAPATAVPVATRPFLVATSTPVPQNVLTVVAQDATATEAARTIGTYTPVPYDVVTPTPLAQNLATAQAIAAEQDLPPVLLMTPTPENEATVLANVFYATAVALTTGTFTPEPLDFVTPALILPSPPAENVATVAARVATATAAANVVTDTPTQLPYNAVLGQYVYATPTPKEAATATVAAFLATAAAKVNGTPTPLPWNVIIITPIATGEFIITAPISASGALAVSAASTQPLATPTPAPNVSGALPAELRNKILFRRANANGESIWAYDLVSGASWRVTQSGIYDLAVNTLFVAADSKSKAVVQVDGNNRYQIFLQPLPRGQVQPLTQLNGHALEPAWSPTADRLALLSTEAGNEGIVIVDRSGRMLARLAGSTQADRHPTWSPDGKQLAFSSSRTGNRQLWIVEVDGLATGTGLRNLSNNQFEDYDPIWLR